ncbi:HAMP domain-containing sensor histidine kinase [Catenulispora subtropica]|uniref:histidine kinase n=1 Tax=Catenulispora subtropica TaxID=450798 RepID=A0ABN2RPV1_9ACTN
MLRPKPPRAARRAELPRRAERERQRHRRPLRLTGLRMRLLAAFAAVALLTSAAVTGVSYVLTRQSLMVRINETSVQQFDAAVNQYKQQIDGSETTSSELQDLAIDLQSSGGNNWVLFKDQVRPATTNDTLTYEAVPAGLRAKARTGAVAWQRTKVNGQPFLILASSVQPRNVEVYDFVSLQPQQEDLNRLAQNSGIASAVAIAISLALGLLASRGVLLPLRRLGIAARRLGSGKLDTRVEVRGNDEVADVSRTFNETADALERSIAELRSLEASSRRFVADVSHELRTPLTAMTAVTDMLEEATDVGDESAPAAQLIVAETRRLARLVEDLMEVSRFDAGTAELRREEVDLVALVHGCLAARGWTGRVALNVPESMPVAVDQRRIDVIVANMVGNAVKHGGDGPVELSIGVHHQNLLLQVRDHGPGIPPDALEHIFERFYKADKARGRSEGSGLGLSIAYENAHIHGGELSGGNHPEGGAVFTLRLPLREPGDLT